MTDLIAELDMVLEDAVRAIQSEPDLGGVFSGETTRENYLRFLEQTYHYVKQTPTTITMAAEAMTGCADPVYVKLRDALLHHAGEEDGHEHWVLNDIRALGGDAEAVRAGSPNPAVQTYLADARFTVTSRHPVAVYGEGYILEGIAQRLALRAVEGLKERSGVANINRALSFLQSHGELDEDHLQELRDVLRGIEDEGDKRAILQRARSTAHQYSHLLHYR